MRSEIAVFCREEWIVSSWWFSGEHIGTIGGELVAVEGLGYGCIVHKRTSACVDEDGG